MPECVVLCISGVFVIVSPECSGMFYHCRYVLCCLGCVLCVRSVYYVCCVCVLCVVSWIVSVLLSGLFNSVCGLDVPGMFHVVVLEFLSWHVSLCVVCVVVWNLPACLV